MQLRAVARVKGEARRVDGRVDRVCRGHLDDKLHERKELVVKQPDDVRGVELHVRHRPCLLMARDHVRGV